MLRSQDYERKKRWILRVGLEPIRVGRGRCVDVRGISGFVKSLGVQVSIARVRSIRQRSQSET